MAGYVCTVAGGKGGVGKTATTANLGAALQATGRDVVLVDADLGMANLAATLDLEPDGTLHQVLARDAEVNEALTEATGGLTVVPGDQRLEAYADTDPSELRRVVETLRNAYDVVLIDTGAGLSHEVAVPLGLADGVVLVTTADEVAIADTVKTAQLADRIDGRVVGAVLNRVSRDTDVAAVAERLGHELLAIVPEDAPAAGQPLVVTAPEAPIAAAFRQLAANLDAHFFDEAAVDDLETVMEAEWFREDGEPGEATGEGDDGDEEDEESGGVFGLFG